MNQERYGAQASYGFDRDIKRKAAELHWRMENLWGFTDLHYWLHFGFYPPGARIESK